MRTRATIAAMGARTGLGLDARETSFLVRAAMSGITAGPLAGSDGESVTMVFDATLDRTLVGEERAVALAREALRDLAHGVPREAIAGLRLGAFVALPEARSGVGRVLGGAMRSAVAEAVAAMPVELVPHGAPGLVRAIDAAVSALESRAIDAAIVGGAHTDFDPVRIAELEADGRLFSSACADGVIPGEGAAFALLTRDDVAHRAGLATHARIYGWGLGQGPARVEALGAGELEALTLALDGATSTLPPEQKCGWIVGDHGYAAADVRALYGAIARVHARLAPPMAVESIAHPLGHLGAAGLAIALVHQAVAHQHGFAPAPLGLALGSSDAGAFGAVTIGAR